MSKLILETETLTDGSKVYNVVLTGFGEPVSIPCLGDREAIQLAYDLHVSILTGTGINAEVVIA